MLTDMQEKRPGNWRWWLLAAGLGFVHVLVLALIEVNFGPLSDDHRRYDPPWIYYAFMNVFTLPIKPIVWLFHLGPNDGMVGTFLIIFTYFLWGSVWAEPFRRKCGWHPWRFGVRELFVLTAAIAGILAWIVWLNHRG
jgi:hypothetical protein